MSIGELDIYLFIFIYFTLFYFTFLTSDPFTSYGNLNLGLISAPYLKE